MGESKDGGQENGKRSAAELAVENKKAKIVSQITGFNEIENEGKGDCLYLLRSAKVLQNKAS